MLDKDFRRLSSLHPVPPSHSTQEEGSSARRKLDSNEQAGGMRHDEKLGHGQDGMREGHMGDDFSSVSGSSPPHCRNHGEYQPAEYHQHDQREEGHRLGASAPSESQSWGDVRPSSHHHDHDHDHWSAPGLGIECPPHDPGAKTSDYQYNATPQHYRPPEQSHSSPHHHSYGYAHGNYGYYAPPGYRYQRYAQADMYNTTTLHIIICLVSRIITTRTLTTTPHQTIQRTTANGIVPIKLTTNMTRITITKLRRQGLRRKKLARISSRGEESWRVASSLEIFIAALKVSP